MIRQVLRFFKRRKCVRVPLLRERTAKRSIWLESRGEHYDLKEIYARINAQYFEGKLDLRITWVGNKNSMPRTQIMFGSYNQRTQLIKIHRRLDQAHVPEHFISFIIYHEMLHHVLPPIIEKNRRRKVHHASFRQREKQFQEYACAKAFSEEMRKAYFQR